MRLSCIDLENNYEDYRGLMHGEDLFQLLPIVDRSTSLLQLSDVLYYYRPSDESSTARYRPSQLVDIVRVNARLRKFAQAWGSRCVGAAAVGEAKQYINLLKLCENSKVSRSVKNSGYEAIRTAMIEEGMFERCFVNLQRFDDLMLLFFLQHNRKFLIRWIIMIVEVAKRTV